MHIPESMAFIKSAILDLQQVMTTNLPTLQILMMPDGRQANPYQSLLAESLEQAGVKVVFPQGYRRGLPFSRQVWSLRPRPNIVHLHWISPYLKGNRAYSKAIYAAKLVLDIYLIKLLGVKVVWTIHNQISHETAFPGIELWLRRCLAKLVDGIILHNQATATEISQEYSFSLEKAAIIPHGHYRSYYKYPVDVIEARQALGLPISGNIFLHLGLLRKYKGIEDLIVVWHKNQELFSNDTLLIVGKASEAYEKELRQLINNAYNVILIPEFIVDEKIHLFLSAATVAVLPYKNILNSGSLLLAMSYALPIIAPKLGSIPEMLQKANWLLYDSDNEDGLLQSLKNSSRISLSNLSDLTKSACDNLSWELIGKNTSIIYQSLFTNRSINSQILIKTRK